MIAKSFLLKVKENLDFVDENERAAFKRLLSQIKENGIKCKYVLTVEPIIESKGITNKQIRLFYVLVNLISQETGQDKDSVKEFLFSGFFNDKISLSLLTSKEFSEFFEWILSHCRDFFGFNVNFNTRTGELETIN